MPGQRSTARAEMWTQDKGSLHVRLIGFWYNLFKTNFYGGAIDNLYVLGSGPHFGDGSTFRGQPSYPGYPGTQVLVPG